MNYLKKELYDLIKSDESIFDFIQESSLDGLWYWDLEQPEEEWMNPKFWITLGFDPKEMPHKASAWQHLIFPEDLKLATQNIQKHLADPSFPYNQIVRYRHKDGSTVWIRCRGLAIKDKNGNPTRVLGAHTDITQQKRKEQLLIETNRIARVGAWELDLNTNTLFWSEVTKEIHEVAPDFQPNMEAGINFYKEGKSRETITKCMDDAIAEGKAFDVELQLVTAKQREVWVRAIGHPVFYEGNCSRIYGVFQDINERKVVAEKLRHLSILESKSKEMEQFAYIASHDLREPLTTIKGYLNLLKEEFSRKMSADANHILEYTIGAASRMDELIHGLLDYSRLSQIKELKKVDGNQIIHDVLVDLSAQIAETKAAFEIQTLPTITAYPLELKLLFQNLISNALKFKKNNIIPKISISHRQVKKGWEFKVTDNGIGIEEAAQERIFYIFQRIHKQKYAGTGIGLANCKKIVELHNGDIWVDSALGKHSSFYFTILTEDI